LKYNNELINNALFSAPLNTIDSALTATLRENKLSYTKNGVKYTPEQYNEALVVLRKSFSIELLEDDEGNIKAFGSKENISAYNLIVAGYIASFNDVYTPTPIEYVQNCVKTINEYCTPVYNASGMPEYSLYEYSAQRHFDSFVQKILEFITNNKIVIKNYYDFNDKLVWQLSHGSRIEFYKNFRSIKGNEQDVLNAYNASCIKGNKILHEFKIKSDSKLENTIFRSHLNDLQAIKSELKYVDPKQATYKAYQSVVNSIETLINSIHNAAV
jgi:hypothetical protein